MGEGGLGPWALPRNFSEVLAKGKIKGKSKEKGKGKGKKWKMKMNEISIVFISSYIKIFWSFRGLRPIDSPISNIVCSFWFLTKHSFSTFQCSSNALKVLLLLSQYACVQWKSGTFLWKPQSLGHLQMDK